MPFLISSRISFVRANSPAGRWRQAMPSDHDGVANEISGEERLIGRYFRPLATAPGAFGLADDAAVLTPPAGCDLVLTTDGVIAGVHFLADDPPGSIARKALRMNLSDLAAKGATPIGFLLSIALPAGTQESWMAGFAAGLKEDIEYYGCPLLGGDTDHTPGPLSVSIAAFGGVPHGGMVRRTTARAGDIITVTGTIGDAALGVLLHRDASWAEQWRLSEAFEGHLDERYLLPQPRNVLVQALRNHASAAMDVSDGLAGDLAKLCRASGVAAEIDVAGVPLSDAARAALAADTKLIERILTGGDDYEILAAVPAAKLSAFQAAAAKAGVVVSKIGQVGSGQGVRFLRDGKVLSFAQPAYTHF
jgi:thiamine-monophosphate kinase